MHIGQKIGQTFERIAFGEFLHSENPFSAAREPSLRCRLTKESDRVHRAWWRTVTALPGAIVVAMLTGPFYRWAGVEHSSVGIILDLAALLPCLVVAFGLATGVPALWRRRTLLRAVSQKS